MEDALSELDPDVIPFIEISKDKKKSVDREKFEKHLKSVDECFTFYMEKSQQLCPKLYSYELPTPNICASGKQKFFFNFLQKNQRHYQNKFEEFFTTCAAKVSQIKYFLSDCFEKGVYSEFKINNFKKAMETKLEKDSELIFLKKRLVGLDKFSKGLKPDLKYPYVTEKLILDGLKNYENQIDEKNDYCPLTGFDDIFCCYIYHYDKYDLFEDLLEILTQLLQQTIFYKESEQSKEAVNNESFNPWNIPKISFLGIAKVYNSIGEILHPESAQQATILRCAVVRFLFNCLYEKCPYFTPHISEKIYIDYNKNCDIIQEKTCEELHINTDLLCEGDGKRRFKEIASKFSVATDFLFEMQFHHDPTEITVLSYKAMGAIEEVIKDNIKNSNKENNQIIFSFDDIFSIYWPLLSMRPIADPIGISLFIKTAIGLKLASSLDFAKTVFVSAVEYVRDYDKEM